MQVRLNPQLRRPMPPPRVKGRFELTNERIRVPEYRLEVGSTDDPYVITGEATLDTGSAPEFLLIANGQQIDVNRIGNQGAGVRVDTTGSTGGTINVAVNNSDITNSGIGIQLKAPAGTAAVKALVTDTVLTNNGNFGIQANGSGVNALVTRSSVMMNNTGVSAINSAVVNSSVDNNLGNNTTDGAFSGTTPHQ